MFRVVSMNSTPSVGTRLGEDGNQYILTRQSASDGQYTVDICMIMEQFSCVMAVVRGLEMYFMDTEVKNLLTISLKTIILCQ